MSDRRPGVFIGSSREGLPIAEALQVNLDRACEVVVWSQGVFGLGGGTLETLVEKLPEFDFAVLILTADDLVESRGEEQPSPRDNVLLELGLCLGALGRERTFVVYDRTSKIKLPSDLAGVTNADYQPHANGNLQAALGAACTLIKGRIGELKVRNLSEAAAGVDQNTHFQIVHDLLDTSVEQLIILMHERGLTVKRDSPFDFGIYYEYHIANRSSGSGALSVDKMCRLLPDAGLLQQDLRGNVGLTPRGHEFAGWLIERGHKADFFETPLGTWGTKPKDSQVRSFMEANMPPGAATPHGAYKTAN